MQETGDDRATRRDAETEQKGCALETSILWHPPHSLTNAQVRKHVFRCDRIRTWNQHQPRGDAQCEFPPTYLHQVMRRMVLSYNTGYHGGQGYQFSHTHDVKVIDTHVFNKSAHTRLRDASSTKDLDSIDSAQLGSTGTIHLQECDLAAINS
jgi:hypothetical protein